MTRNSLPVTRNPKTNTPRAYCPRGVLRSSHESRVTSYESRILDRLQIPPADDDLADVVRLSVSSTRCS